MTSLHHSTLMLDHTTPELPMRITHSFPPRGIVAKILTNSQNTKGRSSLYLYGSFKEHSIPNTTRTKIRNEEDATFSLPQTLTERTFKTRKTPRFYTVDTSSLREQSSKVDHALDQLITNSDVTGLKEIYHKICKGSVTTLQTLISKKKISQKFVFVQNSSPLTRYHHHKTPRLTATEQEPQKITVDQQWRNRESTTSHEKINKRVLVPSPYFNRKNNDKTTGLSETSSQHILYSSSFDKSSRNNASKSPIEPTVINLNDRLPELGKHRSLKSRFPAKSKETSRKQRWGSSVMNSADSSEKNATTQTTSTSSILQNRNEPPKDLQLWTRGKDCFREKTTARNANRNRISETGSIPNDET